MSTLTEDESNHAEIRAAAQALVAEIQRFEPVSGYYTAVIPSRLVMALSNALEGYTDD
jgi:hypothetical protein